MCSVNDCEIVMSFQGCLSIHLAACVVLLGIVILPG